VAVTLALVAVAVAGYIAWKSQQAPATPPVAQVAATPSPTPTPVATPTPPPATPAPAPVIEEAGRAASQIKAANAAIKAGSYDRAAAAAQEALREAPDDANAKRIFDQAMTGQKAAARVREAEAAFSRGDIPGAEGRLAEALGIAPWVAGAAELSRRIEAAKLQAQRESEAKALSARTAQINGLLDQAANAMQARQYEAAIAAYDQVIGLDPNNQAARMGKTSAIGAKSVAEAQASGPRPAAGKSFVPGRTVAKGAEQGGLVGFEDSAGVTVKKGTQAVELPGQIVFEASPPSPRGGERFKVTAWFSNEGQQPIELARMVVTTIVNGGRQSGALPLTVTLVAPGQRALVYAAPGDQVWREGTQSWTMTVELSTKKGETYTNTLSWK
jgi:tetratricopeptide (TPR) repeat protein